MNSEGALPMRRALPATRAGFPSSFTGKAGAQGVGIQLPGAALLRLCSLFS